MRRVYAVTSLMLLCARDSDALAAGVLWPTVCYHAALRGCCQVVRPQLPKLVFAGSSPVTRSRKRNRHRKRCLFCFGPRNVAGLEPMRS